MWCKHWKMRCCEVLFGILYLGTDLETTLAPIWQNLANARRIMLKSSEIENDAKRIITKRKQRELVLVLSRVLSASSSKLPARWTWSWRSVTKAPVLH